MSGISDPNALFQEARRYHQAGDLKHALSLYQRLLQQMPGHVDLINLCAQTEMQLGHNHEAMGLFVRSLQCNPKQKDAWYLSGMAATRLNKFDEAVRCFDQALALDEKNAAAFAKRGLALAAMGALPRAMKDFTRAIALKPDGDLYYNRGTLYLQLNRLPAALVDFNHALALMPGHVKALVNRGNTRIGLKQPEAALRDFQEAIRISPDCVPAHAQCARAYSLLNQPEAAVAACDRALALDPKDASVWDGRGQALLQLDRAEEAQASFRHALTLNGDVAGYHNNLSVALRRLHKPAEALAEVERAIALDPRNYRAHLNHGQILKAQGARDAAIAAFERATEMEPYCQEAWAERGRVFLEMEKYSVAAGSFGRALALNPSDGMSWCNHGTCWVRQNRAAEARYDFEMAQVCDPENVEIRWNAALCALTLGDEAAGWPLYEARLSRAPLDQFVRRFDGPRWRGDAPVSGRRLLLYAEQGAGDVLQFCRYIPALAKAGGHIFLMAQDALAPVLQSLPGVDVLLPLDGPVPAHDLQSPLMSLPLAFQNAGMAAPPAEPYLQVPEAAAATWAEKLGPAARPRIGLVVSGAARHANDHNRSMPLEALAPVLALPGDFYLLQPEVRTADAAFAATQANLHLPGTDLTDYGESAGLMSQLDLVISVDTSVAHLAGAMGHPLWLMLPWAAEWRWGETGDTTHWYPSARLFRQKSAGDWAGLAERVAEQLKKNIFLSAALC